MANGNVSTGQRWQVFKATARSRAVPIQFTESDSSYNLMCFDGPLGFTTNIWKGEVPNGVIEGGYTQEQNDTDKTDFETYYKDNSNTALEPREPDGKRVVVMSPSTEGLMTFFTGAGDHATDANFRGLGDKLVITFSDAGEDKIEIGFREPVEIHDGELFYKPVNAWNPADRFSFSLVIPATEATEADPANTGNANLVNGYLLVPAAGDGTHSVDLSTAIPVPASGAGYWGANRKTGEIYASGFPGKADWHLLLVPVESFFLRNIPMGHPLGVFAIDTYKAEWLHQRWKVRLAVTRVTSGAGEVAGWLMTFRENAT